MEVGAVRLLTQSPWVARRALTVDEYHRMADVGILAEDDRVELIEGELILMVPIGSGHAGTVITLTHLLIGAVGPRALISVQNPVQLDDRTEPEPDFAVLKPRQDSYRSATPRPDDVLLLIEIADSSLAYDRSVKRPLYARHGITELWIVDLAGGEIEVCRTPVGDDYTSISRVGCQGILQFAGLPGVSIQASTLFS